MLLFEIYSEEIPSSMQIYALNNISKHLTKTIKYYVGTYDEIKVYVCSTRITIIVYNLKIVKTLKMRGPKSTIPGDVLNSFLNQNNITKNDLNIESTSKGDYYFYTKINNNYEIIKNILEEFLQKFSWPIAMKYELGKEKWVRPIRNLLCMYDETIIPLQFKDLIANSKTYGHKYLNKKTIEFNVANENKYLTELKNHDVILDQEERIELILNYINDFMTKENLMPFNESLLKHNNNENNISLLEEVAGLIEKPFFIVGQVSQQFMELPQDLIFSVLKYHQKFFCFKDKETKKISGKFIIVVNALPTDQMAKNYHKVINARLSDALFMINQDIVLGLEKHAEKANYIIVHKYLGTIGEKNERVVQYMKKLRDEIGLFNSLKEKYITDAEIKHSVYFAKADLSTKTVNEFPELQSKIALYLYEKFSLGRGYKNDNEYYLILHAIEHQYDNKEITNYNNLLTCIYIIADRMDSLIGLLSQGEGFKCFSSSSDPLGIKRMADNIINILLENKIFINIKIIIKHGLEIYKACNTDFNYETDDLPALFIEMLCTRANKIIEQKKIYYPLENYPNCSYSDYFYHYIFQSKNNIGLDFYYAYEFINMRCNFLSSEKGHKFNQLKIRANNLSKDKSEGEAEDKIEDKTEDKIEITQYPIKPFEKMSNNIQNLFNYNDYDQALFDYLNDKLTESHIKIKYMDYLKTAKYFINKEIPIILPILQNFLDHCVVNDESNSELSQARKNMLYIICEIFQDKF